MCTFKRAIENFQLEVDVQKGALKRNLTIHVLGSSN